MFFQKVSLEWILWNLKTQIHKYLFTSKGNIFQLLGFSSEPILLVTFIYLVTLVSYWMELMATPNFSFKLLTASVKLESAVVNFMTIYQSAVASMARLSSSMDISTAACALLHPDLLEASLVFSRLLWYSCANIFFSWSWLMSFWVGPCVENLCRSSHIHQTP